MATFQVTFTNHLDGDGNTFEFPTDELDANGATIETFEHVESEIRDDEDFAREIWEYEVDDTDAGRFEDGLSRTNTVIEYKRLEQ